MIFERRSDSGTVVDQQGRSVKLMKPRVADSYRFDSTLLCDRFQAGHQRLNRVSLNRRDPE